jgi:hypothetical protein
MGLFDRVETSGDCPHCGHRGRLWTVQHKYGYVWCRDRKLGDYVGAPKGGDGDLDAWIEANPTNVPDALVQQAVKVLDRIQGENSELQELWDEGGRNETWHSEMDDLRKRLARG